jgi:hypothetical protein
MWWVKMAKQIRNQLSSRWFLARGFFYSEDGSDMFLWNVRSHKIYMVHILEDGILHSHRRENLKSYSFQIDY